MASFGVGFAEGFAPEAAKGIERAGDDRRQKELNEQQMAMAPHSQSIAAAQQGIKVLPRDPKTGEVLPEYLDAYNKYTHDIHEGVQGLREILHPDHVPSLLEKARMHMTDAAHITNATSRAQKVVGQQNKADEQDRSRTQGLVQGSGSEVNPEMQKITYAQQAGASPEELNAMRNPLTQTAKTDKDKFVQNYLQRNPSKNREDAERAYTDATTKDTSASKPDAPLEAGGVPYGVRVGGQEYLPSQLGTNGSAPQAAKELWTTIQAAKAAKVAEENKKEDERSERLAKTIGASFDRQGRQQQFTELMAQFRSDLGEYRALDTAAQNSKEIVDGLKAQYAQPGNKSVADNELQNFYTTVVQKGGRKTAAELALTLKIGSLGLNLQQAFQKAATGEMPDELRIALLQGMAAVADEQAKVAAAKKPELPQIGFQGPKTKELKAASGKPAGAVGTVTFQGKKYWVDKDKNNLGEAK